MALEFQGSLRDSRLKVNPKAILNSQLHNSNHVLHQAQPPRL